MNWQRDWRALSANIKSLIGPARFLMESAQVNSSDPYQAQKVLLKQAQETFARIDNFRRKYLSQVPLIASQRLQDFYDKNVSVFESGDISKGTSEVILHGLKLYIALLASFEAEFTYLLSDEKEVFAKSLIERAFLHLQRSIIVSSDVSTRWEKAFSHETKCERLGGVHLLMFGIYAFKVDAIGERTDLVLGTKLHVTPDIERSSEALVLTEWKKAERPNERDSKIEEAFTQARRYARGSLAGFELEAHRYLVLVSQKELEMPEDREEGGVIYHHKNIAIKPDTPSALARS